MGLYNGRDNVIKPKCPGQFYPSSKHVVQLESL